jgi:ferredoxin-like protein FixX
MKNDGLESRFKEKTSTDPEKSSGRQLIENYFEQDGKRARDHSKEMMKFLEKKLLNTNVDEYLKETQQQHEKCIGCATCMSPTHRLISFKYPKNMASRYTDFFKTHARPASKAAKQAEADDRDREEVNESKLRKSTFEKNIDLTMSRQSFNYDMIRNVIHHQFVNEKKS